MSVRATAGGTMSEYDFNLATAQEIREQPARYLIALKRLLPRWANSLPDSEYLTLQELVELRLDVPSPVFVETGIGATTLLFLHYAMLRGGRVISWDMNGSKASFLRKVAAETLEMHHGKAISTHWTFVQSATLSPHTGIGIVGELTDRVSFSHHDSDHTWDTISGEVGALLPHLDEGGIVCVDDANQTYQSTYEPIINMTRRKLGLPPIAEIAGNRGLPHSDRIPGLLQAAFGQVEDVSRAFAKRLEGDLYYEWYAVDRKRMSEVGMEQMQTLEKRFCAFQLRKRRKSI